MQATVALERTAARIDGQSVSFQVTPPGESRLTKLGGQVGRFVLSLLCASAIAALVASPWLNQGLVWCGWLGAAAALLFARRLQGWRQLFWTATWASTAIAAAFHWSPGVLAYTMDSSYGLGVLVYLPLVAWDGARAALPFWFAGRLNGAAASAWFPAALLAVVLEWAVPSVFPWRFGYSQIAWPWIVQAADLFGPEWTTFMFFAHAGAIVIIGQYLYMHFSRPRRTGRSRSANGAGIVSTASNVSPNGSRPSETTPSKSIKSTTGLFSAATICLSLGNSLYGLGASLYWEQRAAAAPSLRVALIQVDPSFVDSAAKLERLSNQVPRDTSLVCWPESSGGTYDLALNTFADADHIFSHSREPNRGLRPWPQSRCDLLFGAKCYRGDREQPDKFFQSALLVDWQERIVGRYHKRHLMPFGEYVPGEGWVPGIDRLFSVTETVERGSTAEVLSTGGGARLGVMLCYEDMKSEAARESTLNSANVLVSLINGSAFSDPLTLRQHRLLAQLRAIECRRTFLRCAATGETCVISPLGTIDSKLPLQTEGILNADVALIGTQTLYCQYGNFFPYFCCVGIILFVATRRRYKK